MFFLRKDSIINNFKKLQPKIYKNCANAMWKAKYKSKTYYLNKALFTKCTNRSFDYAILEKAKHVNAIKLNIPWSDLGNWREILNMYSRIKKKKFDKKNFFYRPWGSYTILFKGENFIIKELYIKRGGILSLQK